MDIKIYTPVGFWPPAAPTQVGFPPPLARIPQVPGPSPFAVARRPEVFGFPPPVARLPEVPGFPPPVARLPEVPGFPPPVARLPEVAGFLPPEAHRSAPEEPTISLLAARSPAHHAPHTPIAIDEGAPPIEQARQIHRALSHHVRHVAGRGGALAVHETHASLEIMAWAARRMDAIAATLEDEAHARELDVLRRDVESARQSFEQIHLGAAQAANFQATYPAMVQSWVALEVARTAALGVAQRQAVIEAARAMSTGGMAIPPGMPMGMPGMGMPGMGMPGMGMPGMGMPGMGMPGLAVPAVGMPAAAAMAVAPGMPGGWTPVAAPGGLLVR